MRVASDREHEETFEADAETERMLLESIAQCDRGQTVPLEKVLAELKTSASPRLRVTGL